jgi:hypothetical protein
MESLQRSEVLVPGALADRIAEDKEGRGPYLCWRTDPTAAADLPAVASITLSIPSTNHHVVEETAREWNASPETAAERGRNFPGMGRREWLFRFASQGELLRFEETAVPALRKGGAQVDTAVPANKVPQDTVTILGEDEFSALHQIAERMIAKVNEHPEVFGPLYVPLYTQTIATTHGLEGLEVQALTDTLAYVSSAKDVDQATGANLFQFPDTAYLAERLRVPLTVAHRTLVSMERKLEQAGETEANATAVKGE